MTYRPLEMSDANFMLTLKNYEETRKFAIQSPDEIKLEDHLKWLEKNKQFFHIIEFVGTKVGAFRIEGTEISIWIDREFWGKRIATTVLTEVRFTGMIAKVVTANIASMRAFVSAGFMPCEFVDEKYFVFKYEKNNA